MRRQVGVFLLIGAMGLMASASAGAQDKTIKIGALFPLSGPGAYFGAQDKQGIELALEQINKDGVNGYKFAIQYEDSACSPLPASQAAKRLIDAGVFAVYAEHDHSVTQFKPPLIVTEPESPVFPLAEVARKVPVVALPLYTFRT